MKGKKIIITSLLVALLCCLSASPVFAASLKAVPSAQALTINGTAVNNIPVYNINGFNYFKLRDIAYYLDYEVNYIESANAIAIMRGGHGSTAGLSKGKATHTVYGVNSSQNIFIDTVNYSGQLHPVNINGNNYFQLRELGQYAAYGVSFDATSNSIVVDSNYNYSKNGLTSPKTDGWKEALTVTLEKDKTTVQQKASKINTQQLQSENGIIGERYVSPWDNGRNTMEAKPSTGIWTGQQGSRIYGFIVNDISDMVNIFSTLMDEFPDTVVFFSEKNFGDKFIPKELCAPYTHTHGLLENFDGYRSWEFDHGEYYEYRIEFHYEPGRIVWLYKEGIINNLPNEYCETYLSYPNADFSHILSASNKIEKLYNVNNQSSDFSKVFAIYRYLTEEFSYDDNLANNSSISANNYGNTIPTPANINYMLIKQKGVCQNFSETFQALAGSFGLNSYITYGSVNGVGHAWNIVGVDGQWYQVDATFDVNRKIDTWKYFLISDTQMFKDHVEYADYYGYPPCPKDYAGINQNEVTSLSFYNPSIDLMEGKNYQTTVTVYPSNATDKTVTYRSSNTSVATVSYDGIITANKAGTATITATSSNNKTTTCIVTVIEKQSQQTENSIQQNNNQSTSNTNDTLETTNIWDNYKHVIVEYTEWGALDCYDTALVEVSSDKEFFYKFEEILLYDKKRHEIDSIAGIFHYDCDYFNNHNTDNFFKTIYDNLPSWTKDYNISLRNYGENGNNTGHYIIVISWEYI